MISIFFVVGYWLEQLTNMTLWFLLIGCLAMVSCAASQTDSQ